MKKNTAQEYGEALWHVTNGESTKSLLKIIAGFASLLNRARVLRQAPRILAAYEKFAKQQAGIREVTITAAHRVSAETLEIIKKVFGNNVEATVTYDPNLLGGLSVKTSDTIFDASLKTQLRNFKNHLIS